MCILLLCLFTCFVALNLVAAAAGEQGNNPNLETGPPTPPAPPPNQPIVMIVIHRLFADDKKIIVSLTERHILHQLDELSDLGHRT